MKHTELARRRARRKAARTAARNRKARMSSGVEMMVWRASRNYGGGYPRGTAAMLEQQFGKTRQVLAALRRRFIKLEGGRYVTTVAGLRALGLRK